MATSFEGPKGIETMQTIADAECDQCSRSLSTSDDFTVSTQATSPNGSASAGSPHADATLGTVHDDQVHDTTHAVDPAIRSNGTLPQPVGAFGEYELIEELARGGMGIVYKARHTPLQRVVALKMIKSGDLASEQEVQRFYIEAAAAANLEHPGIVPVYEVGAHESQHFYSMGYVEGPSLKEQLAGGPFGNHRAATVALKLAEAIQYAHENNIVHRDLKPANVLLAGAFDETHAQSSKTSKGTSAGSSASSKPLASTAADDGSGQSSGQSSQRMQAFATVPRITDFGLAKQIATDSGITATGQVMGTPSYMAPEQASGAEVGPAADIYALGAILYCMLTGRPPFQTPTVMETLKQTIDEVPVSPRQLNRAVDRDIETICLKCLEKSPGRRYESAAALASDLQRYINGEPITARAITGVERTWRWIRRNPLPTAIATLIVIASVTGAGLWGALDREGKLEAALDNETSLKRQVEEALEKSNTAISLRDETLTELNEKNGQLETALESESRLKKQVQTALRKSEQAVEQRDTALGELEQRQQDVVKARDQLNATLYMRQIGLAYSDWKQGYIDSALAILNEADPKHRNWEWDFVHSLCQKSHITHRESGPMFGANFTPGGGSLLTVGLNSKLSVHNPLTGEVLHQVRMKKFCYRVAVSPDGQLAAVSCFDSRVRIVDLEQRKIVAELVAAKQGYAWAVDFSPNGKWLAADTQIGHLTVWDVATGEIVHQRLDRKGDGRGVAFIHGGDQLIRAGREVQIIQTNDWKDVKSWRMPSQITDMAVDPNEDFFVTASADKIGRVWGMDGKLRQVLAGSAAELHSVAVNADGTLIACGSDDRRIRIYRPESGELVDSLLGHQLGVFGMAFDPKENRLVSCGYDNTVKIWPFGRGQEADVFDSGVTAGDQIALANHSNRIAVMSQDGGVAVWDLNNRTYFVLESKGQLQPELIFSPDDRELVIAGKTIQVWDLASKKIRIEFEALPNIDGKFNEFHGLQFAGKDQLLAIATSGKIIRWSTQTGKILSESQLDGGFSISDLTAAGRVAGIALTREDMRLAIGRYRDATGKWLDQPAIEGDVLLEKPSAVVHACEISPDGKLAVMSGGRAYVPMIVDLEQRRVVHRLRGHTQLVFSASFSPDGKRVVTSSRDRSVRIWDVASGLSILNLRGHASPVTSARFSNDGKRLISADTGGVIRIWGLR